MKLFPSFFVLVRRFPLFSYQENIVSGLQTIVEVDTERGLGDSDRHLFTHYFPLFLDDKKKARCNQNSSFACYEKKSITATMLYLL